MNITGLRHSVRIEQAACHGALLGLGRVRVRGDARFDCCHGHGQ
jgi:hypothetical protein